jgi:HK97 family phage portal protein
METRRDRWSAGPQENFPGSDYTDEERTFLTAMDRFKRERRRPFPTWREVLHVLHELGYRSSDSRTGSAKMSLWTRIKSAMTRTKSQPAARFASLVAAAAQPGWWRDDPTEQLRNYSSWVYAAVNAIAQEVAKQSPNLVRVRGVAEHDREPLSPTHPLARLLAHPNPWLTPWELWYLTTVYLELTGNCFWYAAPLVAGNARLTAPGELWIVPTPWVRVIPDARTFVGGYEISVPGAPPERFTPEEIIHLKYPNPLDPHRGLSPLQANALTVDANTELQRSRYQAFHAGQRPGIVLRTEQTLSETTIRRLEEKLSSRFGGRENWHRPLVLEQGLAASPWTLSPAEMDYLNSSRMTRDEIFALFRVPGPIAGLVENMGLGADIWFGARAMFCEGTVQPKLDLIGQSLTRDLARRFGDDVAIEFPNCSPRNPAERRADDELDARTGLRTFNEIRRGRGLEPYADPRFDEPIVFSREPTAPLEDSGRGVTGR